MICLYPTLFEIESMLVEKGTACNFRIISRPAQFNSSTICADLAFCLMISKTHCREARNGTLEARFRYVAVVATSNHCDRNCYVVPRPRSAHPVFLGASNKFSPRASCYLARKAEARTRLVGVNRYGARVLSSRSSALGGGRTTVKYR